MKTNVTCPICKNNFHLEDSFLTTFKKEIQNDLFSELSQREFEMNERLEKSRQEIRESAMKESFLKLKENEKLISDLKDQLFKVRQKIESSSQQASGEIQELLLEEILRNTFPTDIIEPVGKGKNGADCAQIIRTQNGAEIGRILFESKRVKSFSEDWIEKLKKDNLKAKCDLMVIVTSAMPKDIPGKFGIKDGVWICLFEPETVKGLSILLRYSVIKVFEASQRNEFSQEESEKLLSYLHSPEFTSIFENILKGFKNLEETFSDERVKLTRLWKIREQQLQDMLMNTLEFFGSLKGICPSIPEMLEYKKAS